MPIRTQIEAVLRKHATKEFSYVVRDVWKYDEGNFRKSIDSLVDDLCALYPPAPSQTQRQQVQDWLHDHAAALGQFRSLERDVRNRLAEQVCALLLAVPSRETLQKLLCRYAWFEDLDREYCQVIYDELMAWATGQDQTPSKCKECGQELKHV